MRPRGCAFIVITFVALLAAASVPAFAAEPRAGGHVAIGAGTTWLDSSWHPARHYLSLAFELDYRPPRWPFAIALSYDGAVGGSTPDRVLERVVNDPGTPNIDTIALGVRRAWTRRPGFQPFAGVGLAWVQASFTRPGCLFGCAYTTGSDDSVTPYVEGGFHVPVARASIVSWGLRARYTRVELAPFGATLRGAGLSVVAFLAVGR